MPKSREVGFSETGPPPILRSQATLPANRDLCRRPVVDLRDMLPGALAEINGEILVATIRAFVSRGFSGDLSFRFDGQQVLRTRDEIYRPEISVSGRRILDSRSSVGKIAKPDS